jgi:hypothetical protein
MPTFYSARPGESSANPRPNRGGGHGTARLPVAPDQIPGSYNPNVCAAAEKKLKAKRLNQSAVTCGLPLVSLTTKPLGEFVSQLVCKTHFTKSHLEHISRRNQTAGIHQMLETVCVKDV